MFFSASGSQLSLIIGVVEIHTHGRFRGVDDVLAGDQNVHSHFEYQANGNRRE